MAAKDFRRIFAALERQGWGVTQNANGHYRAVPPGNGSIVHFATSSNDHRAVRNTIRDLRASGFVWPEQADAKATEPSPSPESQFVADPPGPRFSGAGVMFAAFESQSTRQPDRAEPDLDALFEELKLARDDNAIAALEVSEAEGRLAECKASLEAAQARQEKTARKLSDTKEAFDKAFCGGAK